MRGTHRCCYNSFSCNKNDCDLNNNKDILPSAKIVEALNVPRGTFLILESFVSLLLKWNEKINLIGRNSAELVWKKHVLASVQLSKYIDADDPLILDVGSGGGFPGVVLSIVKGWKVVLVERNKKKCIFLSEAQSLTGANVVVENKTIEETNNFSPDIIVSRGVTTVRKFLKLVDGFLNSKVKVMLMKGDRCQVELDESFGSEWKFDFEVKHGNSEEGGTIAILSNFKRI